MRRLRRHTAKRTKVKRLERGKQYEGLGRAGKHVFGISAAFPNKAWHCFKLGLRFALWESAMMFGSGRCPSRLSCVWTGPSTQDWKLACGVRFGDKPRRQSGSNEKNDRNLWRVIPSTARSRSLRPEAVLLQSLNRSLTSGVLPGSYRLIKTSSDWTNEDSGMTKEDISH